MIVVMAHVFVQHDVQVPIPGNQHPVGALTTDRAAPAQEAQRVGPLIQLARTGGALDRRLRGGRIFQTVLAAIL